MTTTTTTTTTTPAPAAAPQLAKMRAERDRFVALAFCWGDVLIELDADENIVFAAGPTVPLVDRQPSQLVGSKFSDIIADPDRALASELLGIARRRGRVENVSVRFKGKNGPTVPLGFSGYRLDDLNHHYFFAMRLASVRAADGQANLKRDTESGLYDAGAFAKLVEQKAKTAGAPDSQMTLLALGDLGDLRKRLDADSEKNLLNSVGAFLKANSVDGDAAARLGDDRFGILHGKDVDIQGLQSKIGDIARAVDPTGKGVSVESATVGVDKNSMSEEDLANGLVYAINKFRRAGAGFSLQQLSSNISNLVSGAATSVKSFKKIVAESDFNVALQPIIDVNTGGIHHYEALVRFNMGDGKESPYEHIAFAEETGLIQEFDLAMAKKVVDWLSRTPRNATTSLAVNVSGSSIGSPHYLEGLDKLLKENLWVENRLLFEITESSRMTDLDSANVFVQQLRKRGHEVCLDDFGAGASNFQYLSTMEVDIVKLDGSAVRNARKAPKGRAFMRSLATLCRDLSVGTVAEMIDDVEGLKFVRECGVGYVQGYLFGKPSLDVNDFERSRRPSVFPAWRGK